MPTQNRTGGGRRGPWEGGSAHRDCVFLDHVDLWVVGVHLRRGRQLHRLEGRLGRERKERFILAEGRARNSVR